MMLPGHVGCRADLEIRKIRFAGENTDPDFAFLDATLQIGHDQRRLLHISYVQLRLRAGNFETHVKPDISRDINRARKPRPAEDLPIQASVQDGRILHCIGETGLMLPKINPFAAAFLVAKFQAEEAASCRCENVDVNHAIAYHEVLHGRLTTIELKTFAALVLHLLDITSQVPSG